MPEGFLDRLSCFETLRVYEGRYFRLEEHLERLRFSCESVGWKTIPTTPWFAQEFAETLRLSKLRNALVRLSVHEAADPTEKILVWTLREFTSHPSEIYEKGVAAHFDVICRDILKATDPQVKSSQYTGGVLAFLDKGDRSAHEIFFLDSRGYAAEGTVSNLFILDTSKCLLTPDLASGILKGVTRDFVLELARRAGLSVKETTLTRHDIYTASECFMTNTSSEILPVVRMDGRQIGNGMPGPVTARLLKDFRETIRSAS